MKTLLLVTLLFISIDVRALECADQDALTASMRASEALLGTPNEQFRKPRVLKRHHPSKRKEVATYFQQGDLYYTLFWLVSDTCQAGFIKRTKGKY